MALFERFAASVKFAAHSSRIFRFADVSGHTLAITELCSARVALRSSSAARRSQKRPAAAAASSPLFVAEADSIASNAP